MRIINTFVLLLLLTASANARDSLNIARLTNYFPSWGHAKALTVYEDHAYIITSHPRNEERLYGIVILDVSDLEHVQAVNFLLFDSGESPQGRLPIDDASIIVRDGILYTLTPRYLRAFAIEDPANIELIYEYNTNLHMLSMDVGNEFVFISASDYVGNNWALQFDFSDLDDIIQLNSRAFNQMIDDIVMVGETMILATRQGLIVLDMPQGEPIAEAEELDRLDGFWYRLVGVTEDVIYATHITEHEGYWEETNTVIDISDPENIEIVRQLPTPEGPYTPDYVKTSRFIFYLNSDESGIAYFPDDPLNPDCFMLQEDNETDTFPAITLPGCALGESILYSDFGMYGLRTITPQIDDQTLVGEPASVYAWNGKIGSFVVEGDNMYVSHQRRGSELLDELPSTFRTYEISNPQEPELLGSIPNFDRYLITAIDGNVFYWNRRVWCYIDATNPERPEDHGELYEALTVTNSDRWFKRGNYIHIAFSHSYRIADLHSPDRAQIVGGLGWVDGEHTLRRLVPDGNRVCVVAKAIPTDYIYHLVDISDPSNPELIQDIEAELPGSAYFIDGDYWWIHDDRGHSPDEIHTDIVDMSNPNRPEVVNFIPEMEIMQGYRQDDYVYVVYRYHFSGAARGTGLAVLDLTDPAAPEVTGWYKIHQNMSSPDVFFKPPYIFVNEETHIGVYDCSEAVGVRRETRSNLITDFVLYPSYPNPFNSTSTITYALPYPSNVLLDVYNPLGQRVASLFEGNRQPGIHTAIWTAHDLPSGIYFVRLEGLNKSLTSKIMLIK
ncbi:MAG: T9SS type A sorting domain-containing protein [Calditrichaeota bacterium]|nr:T9SS type A sorting domain-containing protein [Calditrichota bacterium]